MQKLMMIAMACGALVLLESYGFSKCWQDPCVWIETKRLDKMIGKTPEQAKKMLAAWRFHGTVEVGEIHNQENCRLGTVCFYTPNGALDEEARIALWVLAEVRVTPPPP
jgi:hypothetical protein